MKRTMNTARSFSGIVDADALISSIANFPPSLTISERFSVRTSSKGSDSIFSKSAFTMSSESIVVISEIREPIRNPMIMKTIIKIRRIVRVAAGIFPKGFSNLL